MTNEEKLVYIKEGLKVYLLSCKKPSPSEMNQVFRDWFDVIYDKVPKKLYKYRECDKKNYNINALENQKIWVSKPDSFNDTCDALIEHNVEKLEQYSQNFFKLKTRPLIETYNKFYEPVSEEEIDKYINTSSKELASALASFQPRDFFYIFCLCERYDNQKMWVDYTNDGKGFCIGYDISVISEIQTLNHLFPVYYGKKEKTDFFIKIYEKLFNKNHDNLDNEGLKILFSFLVKEESWQGEEEWRFLFPLNKTSSQAVDCNIAESIYLGENISRKHKKRLIKIAKKQDLKVYQREFNTIESKREYNEIKLQ